MKAEHPLRPTPIIRPSGTRDQLVDGHGRDIGDVRISVTDRCNFRCQYCMPAEGLPWLDREALLSYEEIARLVRILSEMGVHDVRLTGGEPLVRKAVVAGGAEYVKRAVVPFLPDRLRLVPQVRAA